MDQLAGLSQDARKLAFDRFRLLQPHLENDRPLKAVATAARVPGNGCGHHPRHRRQLSAAQPSADTNRANSRNQRPCGNNQGGGGSGAGEPGNWTGLRLAQTDIYVAKSRERDLRGLARCKKLLLYCKHLRYLCAILICDHYGRLARAWSMPRL